MIDQNRRVVIKFLPNDIAQGSSFVLKLIGPVQGVVKYYSSFHLAIDLDDDESFYSNIGVIKDIEYTSLSQYKLHTLMINTVVISNSYIRESINYSFSFFMPNSIGIDLLATYTYFLVEFPSFFDILLSIATPKCMLYNLDEKLQIDFVDSCSVIGSQIKILLRRDLSKGYYYNLQINSVRGPSWTVCLNKRWVINLVSNEQNIIVAKSFFNTINTGLQNFIQNPNKTLLFYQDKDGFEIKSYQLTSGVYSNPIKIVSQTGVFKKNYIMTVNQKGIFSNFPEIINVILIQIIIEK